MMKDACRHRTAPAKYKVYCVPRSATARLHNSRREATTSGRSCAAEGDVSAGYGVPQVFPPAPVQHPKTPRESMRVVYCSLSPLSPI